MPAHHHVEITELAVVGEQFPLRLMQLGFQLIQVMDDAGRDLFRYVIPPMCEVPAGPFLMGSDQHQDEQAAEDEMPQHTVTLPAYEIARYPLTVSEYRCFWQYSLCNSPEGWSLQQQHSDRPVVGVSWHDALAYAAWLAKVTRQPWRLPTEAEWEKAARGIDGRIYPWGDHWDHTRANTNDGGPGTTTPVGRYSNGTSPYGAQDMAGQVWEWTSTTYQPYPYQVGDGREKDAGAMSYRVLRGGSWYGYPLDARAACRVGYLPSGFYDFIGARLVRGEVAG
jgi:formylglycine-generating enzyme required for sulfatase activity